MRALTSIFLVFSLLMPALADNCKAESSRKIFKNFSVELPEGWDGDEQSGFISDDSGEYLLVLGKKDEEGDNFIAQVSVYLLPNKPGADSETAAKKLAEAQGDASEPVKKDNFMVFTGEPRTRAMKGKATTMVNATPERLLIIIAQDPQNKGSRQIIESLKGETEQAKAMLGR